MKLFDDPLFPMHVERAPGLIGSGGASYGECPVTAGRIPAGDRDAWHRAWWATAARVAAAAEDSAARGHRVCAAEGFGRATTYHRMAYQPLFGSPVDPRLAESFTRRRHGVRPVPGRGRSPGPLPDVEPLSLDQRVFDRLDTIIDGARGGTP
ncbi:hypothetical protein [Streptomyces sp. NPDC059909]|uniref:hypothetical protein n=1 Tax=Streptomyces sp. NPDC059909 TaxID=3346998 RepID=UPI0036554D34